MVRQCSGLNKYLFNKFVIFGLLAIYEHMFAFPFPKIVFILSSSKKKNRRERINKIMLWMFFYHPSVLWFCNMYLMCKWLKSKQANLQN